MKDVERQFPGAQIQIYATVGHKLSEQMQDAGSFRYGLVNIGADSTEDLEEKFELCKTMLDFELEPVGRVDANY